MDMLFKRYACPFVLLDEMLINNSFNRFIDDFVGILNDEQNQSTLWEFYLHKVFDMSFEEFKNANIRRTRKEEIEVDQTKVETTVKESMEILKLF